ncbi:MAG TPA: HAD family hydrolase [Gammaproteobacteria bacterium]
MIKAALFDLDGTLYDRDALANIFFEQQYRAFASELRGITRERFLRDVYEMDEHGHGEKASGYARLVRAWQLDDALAPRLVEHFFTTYAGLCVPSEANAETLRELRQRGLKLGVITNGPGPLQRRKLAALALDRSFDAILVSGEEGVRKPDAEIFRRALARLGVEAHEAMFVGDHPVADVEGAHRAGLLAVWMFVPYWPPPDVPDPPVIDFLHEILPIVDGEWGRDWTL